MPSPHRSHSPTALYADTSTAVLDRGLDLDTDEIALKSIANTHATADATPDAPAATPATDPAADPPLVPDPVTPPRLPPLRPPLPPEGMQTLLSSCSRISGILLGLSSAVRDAAPAPEERAESAGADSGGRSAAPAAHSAGDTPPAANHVGAHGEPESSRAGVCAAGTADCADAPQPAGDPSVRSTPSTRRRGAAPCRAEAAVADGTGAEQDPSAAGTARTAQGQAGPDEARAATRLPPLSAGGVPAQASEAAEALSQHVRATAARMSYALEQMARLLAPTAVPLGLAVLCAQCAPPLSRIILTFRLCFMNSEHVP